MTETKTPATFSDQSNAPNGPAGAAGAGQPSEDGASAGPAPQARKEATLPYLSGVILTQAVLAKDVPRIDPRAGHAPSAGQLVDTVKLDRCLLRPAPGPAGAGAAGGLRHLRPSRLVLRRQLQRGACAGDHPGDLPVSPAGRHRRAAVHRHRYACAVAARLRERAGSAGRQRRRGHDLAGRRIHADAGGSHAILVYNRGREHGLADGIVITPSHNPPEDGGFKYNPPNGGPADTDVTGWIENAGQRAARGRPARRKAYSVRSRRGAPPPRPIRFSQRLRRRSRQRDRFRRHPRLRHPHGRGSVGRRRRALLGADRRALPDRSHRGQRAGRSDLQLHDAGLGRPHPHGPVLVLRDAAPDRPQGQIRYRLRLRHRP